MKAQDLYKVTHDSCVDMAEFYCLRLRIDMWFTARRGYTGADRHISKTYSEEFMEVCAPRLRTEGYTVDLQITREDDVYDILSIEWRPKAEEKKEGE